MTGRCATRTLGLGRISARRADQAFVCEAHTLHTDPDEFADPVRHHAICSASTNDRQAGRTSQRLELARKPVDHRPGHEGIGAGPQRDAGPEIQRSLGEIGMANHQLPPGRRLRPASATSGAGSGTWDSTASAFLATLQTSPPCAPWRRPLQPRAYDLRLRRHPGHTGGGMRARVGGVRSSRGRASIGRRSRSWSCA
jgi:hypothetical protein